MRRWLALVLLASCDRSSSTSNPPPPPPPARDAAIGPPTLAATFPGARGGGLTMGTAAEVIGAIADPKRRWAVLCQLREDTDHDGKVERHQESHFAYGDKPSPYLVLGGGPGTKLERTVAMTSDGDRLVVVDLAHAMQLVDIDGDRATPLPDAHPIAAFSADGRAVFYATRSGHAVRRELATSAIREVALPAGEPVAVVGEGSARWAMFALRRGEASISLPHWMTGLTERCGNGGPSNDGPSPTRVWVDFDRGVVLDDPAIVRPVGDHVYTRSDHAVMLDGKPVGPANCTELDTLGVVDASPPRILLHCLRDGRTTHFVGEGFAALELPGGWTDRLFTPIAPVLTGSERCIQVGDHDVCIDLASGATHTAPWHRQVDMGYTGDRYIYAYDREGTQVLDGPASQLGPVQWAPAPRR